MKHIVTLFLIFCLFKPAVILAQPVEPELFEDLEYSEYSVEEIPWDLVPGENLPEEEDDDDTTDRPIQEYNVNININENQQPYYPYFFPRFRHGFFRGHLPPRKPMKSKAFRRPWTPSGKPTRR